jgi:hypothetical protein
VAELSEGQQGHQTILMSQPVLVKWQNATLTEMQSGLFADLLASSRTSELNDCVSISQVHL